MAALPAEFTRTVLVPALCTHRRGSVSWKRQAIRSAAATFVIRTGVIGTLRGPNCSPRVQGVSGEWAGSLGIASGRLEMRRILLT